MPETEGLLDGMNPGRRDSDVSTSSTWSDYRLEWLFDPKRVDHLPIEEQLAFFHQRDLRKVKIYKIATKIWGLPSKRKRKIIAPPMYPNRSGLTKPTKLEPLITSELNPQIPPPEEPTKEEIAGRKEREKLDDYKNWISDRKAFRNKLENMGLNEDWLTRKSDKTPLENRVLNKIIRDRTPHDVSLPPPIEEPILAVLPVESPEVKRPSPLAIRIIEKFLHEKKIRLLDLFASVDKDKNWRLSRDEFRQALQKAKIPISDVLLEDLILTLDTDLNNELDYRELAKGMGLWKIEKRESKRKLVSTTSSSPTKYSQMSGFESPEHTSSLSTSLGGVLNGLETRSAKDVTLKHRNSDSPTRIKSALSNISSTSSFLEPPPMDLRPEQRLESSEEAMLDLRKRDREALARLRGKSSRQSSASSKDGKNVGSGKTVIKTGDRAVDDHSMPTTLTGEIGDMVDKFRQLKLKEYNEIVNLCENNDMVFTEDLLSKVLLYPPDKLHCHLKKSIRQPAESLLSQTFADPPKRPKTPVEERKTEKVKLSRSGKTLVDSRHAYPPRHQVAPVPTKMHLSTGKAVIRRHVDCWLSFEEYENLTQHLTTRFTQLNSKVDDNVFWPGQLLKKLRLCMPEECPKTDSVFVSVKKEKKLYPGNNNDLKTWPVNESGYVQDGVMDPYKNKFI